MDHETEKWVVDQTMLHKARLDGHDERIGTLEKRPGVALPWDVRILLYAIFGAVVILVVLR